MATRGTELTTTNAGQGNAYGGTESGRPGLFGLIRKNWQAHLAEGATEAELRILACQVRVIEGRRAVAEAELKARISLADIGRDAMLKEITFRRQAAELALQADEAEEERRMLTAVRQASPEQARRIIGADLETQRLLKERDQLRRERLGTRLPVSALPPQEDYDNGGNTSLEVHVSDQQIEALAVRALTRFANLPPDEADQKWEAWRRELYIRLPRYAAAQVEARADDLRRLSG